MRMLPSSALVLMLSAGSVAALTAPAHAQVSISVNVAPPPLPVYEQPPMPADNLIWAPGYWSWSRAEADYYWVPGTWVPAPRVGLLWTPGYWGWSDTAFVFYPGYWATQVGFYGGVDYGYGYTGDGYFGGRWQDGAFFYNRAVNNVSNVHVTNVYDQTVVVNNRTNYVSYSGGNGGIEARATPEQEAVAKERHIAATPEQTRQVEAASKNRALFSKENHGQPVIAATAKPGAFEGEGVTHAKPGQNANVEPAKGEMAKPQRQGEAEKPAPKGEMAKPERQGEAEKPAPKGEMAKPERQGEAEKPAPKGEMAKPERQGEAEKPAPKAMMAKPEAEKPAPKAMMAKPEAEKPAPKAEMAKPEIKAEKPEPKHNDTQVK
jgi:hypothetical protein